ncbi:MAG: Fe-S protein assembly co-chaperone HscB [Halioglobus sp.]|nr:Fe-S protein assembly co-chaperone HscB [Halioglobus sp.]
MPRRKPVENVCVTLFAPRFSPGFLRVGVASTNLIATGNPQAPVFDMTLSSSFADNYFRLFDLPQQFAVDPARLGERYRQLQGELHPDRHAHGSDLEQRMAVQYSALVNEAYATLRRPLSRALYLLQLAGMSAEEVAAQQVDGSFLITQMELREKLETVPTLVDPDEVLEHLVAEISADLEGEQEQFARAHAAGDIGAAASACVRMQYLDKLLQETEQLESDLMD